MIRIGYLLLGSLSLLLGGIGIVLPLLPTVPFMLLAAFFFARSHPRFERWLVEHPRFGPHIQAWRSRGAISRRGKTSAFAALAASALLGLFLLDFPWSLLPLIACTASGTWIATRPDA
ncbi:YbaN family protein [Sphingosinicella sp. CPCC 101087]|uniref:YbaN family protein n=1 Tax=Sphingosinicella sp. CPCC 101087 TaxID=2497754 RepID=UPI00101D2178|nr:YbaN family protein [Sphingosinicella sp. CPCC 101087]